MNAEFNLQRQAQNPMQQESQARQPQFISRAIRNEAAMALRKAQLRPTVQRISIFIALFGTEQSVHVTANGLHRMLSQQDRSLSLATVYNTLRVLVKHGLLMERHLTADTIFYDTNTSPHHHLVIGDAAEIHDIPFDAIAIGNLPELPQGLHLKSLDIVLRADT